MAQEPGGARGIWKSQRVLTRGGVETIIGGGQGSLRRASPPEQSWVVPKGRQWGDESLTLGSKTPAYAKASAGEAL